MYIFYIEEHHYIEGSSILYIAAKNESSALRLLIRWNEYSKLQAGWNYYTPLSFSPWPEDKKKPKLFPGVDVSAPFREFNKK